MHMEQTWIKSIRRAFNYISLWASDYIDEDWNYWLKLFRLNLLLLCIWIILLQMRFEIWICLIQFVWQSFLVLTFTRIVDQLLKSGRPIDPMSHIRSDSNEHEIKLLFNYCAILCWSFVGTYLNRCSSTIYNRFNSHLYS